MKKPILKKYESFKDNFLSDLRLSKDDVENGKLKKDYTNYVINNDVVATDIGLTTMEGLPSKINGDLFLNSNYIENFDYCPDVFLEIYLSNNRIKDLKNIPKIETTLDLSDCPISSFEGLENIDYNLFLKNTNITDLKYLPKRINKHLNLKGKRIQKYDNNCEFIEKLSISYGKRFDVTKLPEINILSIFGDNFIEKLDDFTNINSVHLHNSLALTSLGNVPKNIKLVYIYKAPILNTISGLHKDCDITFGRNFEVKGNVEIEFNMVNKYHNRTDNFFYDLLQYMLNEKIELERYTNWPESFLDNNFKSSAKGINKFGL